MKYGPQNQHRRSIRLPEYDYSQLGAYFITICTWGRAPFFGEIHDGVMRLSAAGRIVEVEWKRLMHQFANIKLDAFVVMPNHVHGIIVIHGPVGATRRVPDDALAGVNPVPGDALSDLVGSPVLEVGVTRQGDCSPPRPKGPAKGSLGAMVGQFKSRATKRIRSIPEFDHVSIWQRNFYEHIIRNAVEWERIYGYFQNNPLCWEEDQLHPNAPNNPFNQD